MYRHSLLCTYCTNSRSRGLLRKRPRPKNKRQFSNPWRPKCSEGSCSGHEKRSGRCRALNATVSMFDNFVWLLRTCVPGGVYASARPLHTFSHALRQCYERISQRVELRFYGTRAQMKKRLQQHAHCCAAALSHDKSVCFSARQGDRTARKKLGGRAQRRSGSSFPWQSWPWN